MSSNPHRSRRSASMADIARRHFLARPLAGLSGLLAQARAHRAPSVGRFHRDVPGRAGDWRLDAGFVPSGTAAQPRWRAASRHESGVWPDLKESSGASHLHQRSRRVVAGRGSRKELAPLSGPASHGGGRAALYRPALRSATASVGGTPCPAEIVEAAEMEATLTAHREWVASYPIFDRRAAAMRRFWRRITRRGRLVRTSRSSSTRSRWTAPEGSARRYTSHSPKLLAGSPKRPDGTKPARCRIARRLRSSS